MFFCRENSLRALPVVVRGRPHLTYMLVQGKCGGWVIIFILLGLLSIPSFRLNSSLSCWGALLVRLPAD